MELANKEWKEFRIGDIFSVKRGKRLIKDNRKSGILAYYSASDSNNGLTDFISNPLFVDSKKIIYTTFGDVYYVSGKFTASDEITILGNKNLNKYNGLFVSMAMKNNRVKFAFGYKAFTERVKRQTILLPVNSKGEPDYVFMENYMRQKETELLKQYKKQVSDFESVAPLSEKEWKDFRIGDIFSVSTGSLVPKETLKKGTTVRLTATDNNNGVFDFYEKVEHKNYREVTNFISVSFLGSVFYHPYTASLDMKIHAVQIPDTVLNRYLAEFLVFCFKRMASIYSYGDQLSSTDLPKKKILLPTNSRNEPDYAYMENYMKALENKKISQYLEYKKQNTSD